MSLKKYVVTFILAICFGFGGSVYGQSIAEMADDASQYTQTEKGYILKFDIVADAEEMELIREKVAKLSGRLSLEVLSHVNGRYNVIFTVTHQNHASYVFKMMSTCGFKSVNYKNENYPLFKVVEILESYE